MEFLQNETENVEEIFEKWNDSHGYRMAMLSETGLNFVSTADYMDKFAFLNEPNGYKLVRICILF